MRTSSLLGLCLALLLVACGGGGGGSEDAGTMGMDSGTTREDSGTTGEDSGTTREDSGASDEDAGGSGEDGGTTERDGGTTERDGGPVGRDSGLACGDIGAPCDPRTAGSCPGGLICGTEDGRRGVCIPMTADMCGGIVPAGCPDPSDHCFYYGSSETGACLDDAERDCVCATELGAMIWGDASEPCASRP